MILVRFSIILPNIRMVPCSDDPYKSSFTLPLLHNNSPVSVVQVNTSVSPGHALSADEFRLTIELHYQLCYV